MIILAIVVSLFFGINLCAQNQDIKFEQISLEDGLSQVTINCILQDQDGFMWFASYTRAPVFNLYQFLDLRRARRAVPLT